MTPAFIFYQNVKLGTGDQCWLWRGEPGKNGYGEIQIGGSRGDRPRIYAHRQSWLVNVGPIPDELLVLHHCDVRLCVNPRHLFLGTQRQNVADMIAKRRNWSKLTAEQAAELRHRRLSGESAKTLSAEFGVSTTVIYRIARRLMWR